MLVIGLTGGIGSGKSTVANLFAERGVPVIDTDVIARDVTRPDEPAFNKIAEHYGADILHSDGTLNRIKLKEIIFTKPAERKWLEEVLHPIILNRVTELINTLETAYCIVVIPLLFETKRYELLDRVAVVDTQEKMQKERVTLRDKLAPETIDAIMKTQVTRQERLQKADDVITNNGLISDLEKQVQILHKQYLALASTQSKQNGNRCS